MQILSGWTRQRLSKCDCERERRPFGSRRPLAASRERILCCGRKINNGRAEPFVEQDGERIVRLPPPPPSPPPSFVAAAAAADFPRSADASLAFSVCSTNKPSSLKKPVPHRNVASARAFLPSPFSLPAWSPHSLVLRSSIEAPFDRFFETKMTVKISKEVSFTVVTALVDTASIVLICCFQRVDRLGRALFRVCRINITPPCVGPLCGFFYTADK